MGSERQIRSTRRRPRRRKDGSLGWAGLGGILLLLLAISSGGALAYFYLSTPARPVLDAQSLCPVSGPQGVTVVLVDTSDDLPETTRREVLGELDDMITTLPPLYRLDIRVLDIAGGRSRSLFSKCNPGDGASSAQIHVTPPQYERPGIRPEPKSARPLVAAGAKWVRNGAPQNGAAATRSSTCPIAPQDGWRGARSPAIQQATAGWP